MDANRLHILPVYSQKHPDPAYQIGEVRLLRHQVETLEAFRDPNVDVIFNVAMTGDGKSLAAYLPTFQDHKQVIAMYPTNELVRDQCNAIPRYEQSLHVHLPCYDTMYSDKISQLMRERDISVRVEIVRGLLMKNGILLTNPDLIHLMMSYQYGWDHLRKELPVTIGAYFDYFLFDEFHVFGVPQVISVMNMVGYLTANYQEKPADRKKFVFLSATPNKLLDRLLERGGLRYRRITGKYASSPQEGYHCILRQCDLELHEVSQEMPTELWIEDRLEEIHRFFEKHPDSKAAILVYSVATARRLVAFLKERLERPYGITIGENTGLTNQKEKEESFQKHILVGTSTVDIGVDFHINYLIFEAYNSGSFLQRFGRLGRHDEFSTYRAYALIPRFVLERLTNKFEGVVEVEREAFNQEIREAFPTEQEFETYTKLWGVVQAAQVLAALQNQSKKDANQAFTDALAKQYELLYGTATKPAMPKALRKYRRLEKQAPHILTELQSFRGQSPLSCGVWDTDDHLKTYDLFFLLANTEFEVLPEAVFLQAVRDRQLEERDFKEQLLYLKIHKYVPERLQLLLHLPCDLGELSHTLHHVQEPKGFSVQKPRHTWLDQVNRRLKELKLVCILSDMGRKELKQKLRLGAMFPVYQVEDRSGNCYSVTFGQEALLLDSILFFRETKGDRAIQA